MLHDPDRRSSKSEVWAIFLVQKLKECQNSWPTEKFDAKYHAIDIYRPKSIKRKGRTVGMEKPVKKKPQDLFFLLDIWAKCWKFHDPIEKLVQINARDRYSAFENETNFEESHNSIENIMKN